MEQLEKSETKSEGYEATNFVPRSGFGRREGNRQSLLFTN